MSHPAAATRVRGKPGASPPQTGAQRIGGITANDLAEKIATRPGIEPINPDALKSWLIDSGLAELHGNQLRPTPKAVTMAGALEP